MNYTHLDKKLEMSSSMQSVLDALRARLKRHGLREGGHSGPEPTGKTPFLDVFEENPDLSYVECLAKGIVRSWHESTFIIYPGEILVGEPRPDTPYMEHFAWGLEFFPKYKAHPSYEGRVEEIEERVKKLYDRMNPMNLDPMLEEEKRRLGEEAHKIIYDNHNLWGTGGMQGHTIPSYKKLLTLGLDGTLEEIRKYESNTTDEKKLEFYRACRTIVEGLSSYATLYADHARTLAANETDPQNKFRYEEIAKNCDSVAHKAPTTFYEAVQLMWFYTLWDWVDSIGRGDQYLYPFYAASDDTPFTKKDIASSLMFKILEHGVHNLTIGGVIPETGEDATNELSFLLLQILRVLHETHPRMSIRVAKSTPDELIALAVQIWSEGMCDPTVVSDTLVIDGLRAHGASLEDARDYSMLGCQEIEIQGKSNFGCEDGLINLAKIFEYTINNGYDRLHPNVKIGLDTGRLTDFNSIDELWEAYKKQLLFFIPIWVDLVNLGQMVRDKNVAKLVKSIYTDDCLARGINMDGGGAIYGYGVCETAGSAAVADSFAALEKLVFIDKKLTMAQIEEAIDVNFEGHEDIRLMLLSAPKFGNDDDFVDKWHVRVLEFFWGELGKHRSIRGGAMLGACSLLEQGIPFGHNTWALPDGRHKGEPLGNSIGPRPGNDKDGITAMLKSVTKLPLHLGLGGTTLNVLIPQIDTRTEEQRAKTLALVRAYLENGGQMAQITTANLDDLLDALVHPEAHENLIVRVGGLSARFIQISPQSQKEVISRFGK